MRRRKQRAATLQNAAKIFQARLKKQRKLEKGWRPTVDAPLATRKPLATSTRRTIDARPRSDGLYTLRGYVPQNDRELLEPDDPDFA